MNDNVPGKKPDEHNLVALNEVTRQKQAERTLKATEAKFRGLFDAVVDPLFIHDLEGNFLEVNASACSKLGYSRQQLLEMNVAEIGKHVSDAQIAELFSELQQSGEILFESVHQNARDGRQFPVEIHSHLIEYEGRPAVLSLARDISRRREAEQRYELLSNVTFDGILVHKQGVAVDVNASCSRLTGYSRDELVGKDLFALIATPEDRARARQKMMIHEVAPYVIKVRRKDGRVFDAELEARNIDHQGEQVRIVAIRDVTDKHQMQLALQERFKELRGLYMVSKILEDARKPLAQMLQEIVTVIPPAWQYPDLCYARIEWQEQRFATPNYADTRWRLYADFRASGQQAGVLTVGYVRRPPAAIPEQPVFLAEEVDLIRAMAERIGNIIERKQSERALQASKDHNQRLADATFEAIFFSEQGICTDQNNTAERMFGYALEEAVGRPGTDWIHPDYRGLVRNKMRDGAAEPYEAVALRKDGSTFPCEIQAKTAFHGDRPVRITALRDITERKKHENRLKHRLHYEKSLAQFSTALLEDQADAIEHALRTVLECSDASRIYIFENFSDASDGLCMKQTHEVCAEGIEPQIDNPVLQHVVYAADGFARWQHSLSQDQIIQGKIADFPEAERQILEPQAIQAILIIPLWVNHAWFGFIGFDDIRRPRAWDAEDVRLLHTAAQMLGAFIERQQARRTIQDALAEKEVLLKEIHHRVKNNMQTIASLLYKQQQHTDDEQARTVLDDSITRIKSMALIHEQIYRSKSLARINLADYIQTLANKLFHTYKPRGRAIALHVQVNEIALPIDRSIPVALILNELLTNALKYAFPDNQSGDLWIECEQHEGQITLRVRDNGIGLPEGLDLRQVKSLGLYLVYNLATKQLGGALDVHAADPTEFVIRFK